MRTSGADGDLVILFIPLAAVITLGVILLGGPSDLLRLLDRTVMEAVYWVSRQF